MQEPKLIGNRYETRETIGQGGMGAVYRGVDTLTGQIVAIKVLRNEIVAEDPTILERFEREGEALRLLNHPNIVKMLATIAEAGNHYIVMEYVGGGSLQDMLNKHEQLPISRVLDIGLDLADALTRAHRLKIIHRDIKPGNVLLTEDGTPKLTDFGIAQMGNRTRMTQGGALVGTYAYLSPEVCMGEDLDARTDIWSFGVLLYEMLAGRRPFEEAQPGALLTAIISKPVPPITEFRQDVIPELAELIGGMLEKDRNLRISSVRLVGADLETIISNADMLDTSIRTQITSDHQSGTFSTPTPSAAPLSRKTGTLPSRVRTPTSTRIKMELMRDLPSPLATPPPQVPKRIRRSPMMWAIAAVTIVLLLAIGAAFILPSLTAAPTEVPITVVEPVEAGRYMVLVGQLERLEGDEREYTRLLADSLRQTLEVDAPSSRLSVREYPQLIRSSADAQNVATVNNAAIVLWGNYSGDVVEINLEVGSTTPFPLLNLPLETIQQVANLRLQVSDLRQQSIVPEVLVMMAALLSADGNTYEVARTISVIEQLDVTGVTVEGTSVAARYHRAVSLFFSDTNAALNELNQAINLNATNPLLYALRTLVQLRLGNMSAVVADAQTTARLGPQNWALPTFSLATNALFFEQDLDAALQFTTELVTLRPDDWFTHTFRAAAYYQRGEYDLASEDAARAIELGPTANFAFSLAASIAMHRNRVDDARTFASRALTEFPDPTQGNRSVSAVFGTSLPVIEMSVAFTNMGLGQFDSALQTIDSVLRAGAPTSDVYLMQGLAYCNLHEYDLADEAYTNGIAIDENFWLLYLLRAEVRQKGGNLIGALQDISAVQNGDAGDAYADVIARGLSGEDGLDCESFFSPAS
ncbi:MAG: serine/threonine-protein kinase [Anaerolineae bacterium]